LWPRDADLPHHPMPAAREVWFERTMGLLDDAIREHLELKRLRGADPNDVSRLQAEALGPVHGPHDAPSDPDETSESGGSSASSSASVVREQYGQPTGSISSLQETAEIDMQSVLDSEGLEADAASRPDDGLPETDASGEDSLEWETPTETSKDGASMDNSPPGEESLEDVLEETPDFLQETPEHERLWFEQQPPRDFDFDK
jgi:hypothetical protein